MFEKGGLMAEVATKSKPITKLPEAHAVPANRFMGLVGRTAKLSDSVLMSLETSERDAIEAVGRFVITIEETLPREVTGTADVAKTITQSGIEMADRLVHAEYVLLRELVGSTACAFRRDGAKPITA
jgi:hypothetical protein